MDYKSRTQKKKEASSLQALGEQLVKLSEVQLDNIGLPAEIYNAVMSAKTMKSHGARRRQMQYIGTLMRSIDPRPVREALDHIQQGDRRKAGEFKETELWRDELMAGNKPLMEEILQKCPSARRQHLTQLVRNAISERDAKKPPKAFRSLFRYLSGIRSNSKSAFPG